MIGGTGSDVVSVFADKHGYVVCSGLSGVIVGVYSV